MNHQNLLLAALERKDAPALQALFADGADPNTLDAEGTPLVLEAVETGQADLVVRFLDAGASLESLDDLGYTPLLSAISLGSFTLVEVLLERGANPNAQLTSDGTERDTALTLAVAHGGDGSLVRALCAAGARVDDPRPDGWTPLMLAAEEGNTALVEALLDAGANPRNVHQHGFSAVELALRKGHGPVVEQLRAASSGDPLALLRGRLERRWAALRAWFQTHAPACEAAMAGLRGATEAELVGLEDHLGLVLPAELRIQLALFGGTRGAVLGNYVGLSVEEVRARWSAQETLRAEHRFALAEPRALDWDARRIQWEFWHPAWIPFGEDSEGNLLCLDLAPGEFGAFGQILGWEKANGPVGPLARSFDAWLDAFDARLAGGGYRYDAAKQRFEEGD